MYVNFSSKAKKAISSFVLLTMMTTTTVNANVPVIDVSAIAQAVAQVQNQIRQIETMRNQFRAITGNAGLGVLLNDPNVQKALAKYTPRGISLSDLASGHYDRALQQIAKRIEEDMKQQKEAKDPQARLAQATLINYAQTEKSLADLDNLAKRTQRIMQEINRTTDASSKADLTNTLTANSTQIQIAIAQINLKMRQLEQLERQAKQVATEAYGKKMFQK